jgi:hypothetical protein
VLNTIIPSSQIKKEQVVCAYHHVWEVVTGKVTRFIHIPPAMKCANVHTKSIVVTLHHWCYIFWSWHSSTIHYGTWRYLLLEKEKSGISSDSAFIESIWICCCWAWSHAFNYIFCL